MTQENYSMLTVLLIKGAISELPAAQMEACHELAEHIRQTCKVAGEPVGTLALALVGAETQVRVAQRCDECREQNSLL